MNKDNILFFNHKQNQCGVYQYGYHIGKILNKAMKYNFIYCEIENESEYFTHIAAHEPFAIFYNYNEQTMAWLGAQHLKANPRIAHFGLHHEGSPPNHIGFDNYLSVDSNFPETFNSFAMPRPLFENVATFRKIDKEVPVISSFGFGFGNKGFGRVVKAVNDQFEEAVIRLHIPRAFYGDRDGHATAQIIPGCLAEVKKPGIKLQFTHDFLNDNELLKFLGEGTLNIFLYDEMNTRGLSSVIDYALSVNTPLAISKSGMFRHIYNTEPSICYEDRPLKDIIASESGVLQQYRDKWSHANLIAKYEQIADRALKNFLLTDEKRELYGPVIKHLFKTCPEMMARKYERANVQQAFVLDTVKLFCDKTSELLSVGCFEDTAYETIKAEGYNVVGIDPEVNVSLETFFHQNRNKQYDVVFSTSVIEHVPNDELFIHHICQLIKPGGVGVLTCDFKDGWKPGDPKPEVDSRLYTKDDLLVRFNAILQNYNCAIMGPDDYSGEPDFDYGLFKYSFASFVFKKLKV